MLPTGGRRGRAAEPRLASLVRRLPPQTFVPPWSEATVSPISPRRSSSATVATTGTAASRCATDIQASDRGALVAWLVVGDAVLELASRLGRLRLARRRPHSRSSTMRTSESAGWSRSPFRSLMRCLEYYVFSVSDRHKAWDSVAFASCFGASKPNLVNIIFGKIATLQNLY